MRKTLLFASLTLCTFAFVGCNKEEINKVENNEGTAVHFTIYTNAPETKSFITYDSGTKKYTPGWHNGDELGVLFDSWSANDPVDATFTNTAPAGPSAIFSGTGTVKATEQTIYAFYPASAFVKAVDSDVIGLTIPTTQKPTGTSFDKDADLLVSKPYPITIQNTSVTIDDIQFARVLSTLKVTVTDGTEKGDLDGDEISSITIQSTMTGAALTGRFHWDYASQTGTMHQTIVKNEVSADLTDNPVTIDGSSPIYLMVNPTTLTSGTKLNITISTNNHEITKEATLSKDFVFPAGGVAKLNITVLDTDTIGDPILEPEGTGWYLVRKGSWLKAGDKIVITNLDSNGALGAANGSYRSNVSVSATDGKLTIGDATQLTLAAGNTSGSWALKEGDNYLYHSGDKSVGTKDQLDDNGSWDIKVTSTSVSIRNVGANSYYLQYNSGSPRYTTYTGTQKNVLIYKQYTQPELAALDITVAPDNTNKKITVTWNDVEHATNYAVTCTGQDTKNIAAGVETADFTGLSYGTEYTITVTASAAGYVSSSDSDVVTLVNPAAKTITRLKASITGVAASGVTNASESGVYSLTNATDGDLTVTPDGTVVTAASASSGTVTYTVAKNTGAARDGSITIEVSGGNSIEITVSQLSGVVTPTLQYTLDGTVTGGSNGYATESVITQTNESKEIGWKATGNTTTNPWRIGGNSITSVDRAIYSTTAISSNITSIEVTSGTDSGSITVNSLTITVHNNASDAASGSNAIATKTENSSSTIKTEYYWQLIPITQILDIR